MKPAGGAVAQPPAETEHLCLSYTFNFTIPGAVAATAGRFAHWGKQQAVHDRPYEVRGPSISVILNKVKDHSPLLRA